MTGYQDYVAALIRRFWNYVDAESLDTDGFLDSTPRSTQRPPVFRRAFEYKNILIPPDADEETEKRVVSTLPVAARHRHFASMRSSQALAQSVFGNLAIQNALGELDGMLSEEGLPAFDFDLDSASMQLEHTIHYLGEPRPTSVDVWFDSGRRVAVECKLTEPDFGTCSRPRLRKSVDRNFERDYCNGTYTRQRSRQSRCSLTEIGVQYWTYIPDIFHWASTEDASPCPLRDTYQLARNILAACVDAAGKVDVQRAYVLVIYDANNPEFQDKGIAQSQIAAVQAALKVPEMLRSISWQSLVAHLKRSGELSWLTAQLQSKYGFR